MQVIGAPLAFFQITESGRITSRFSSDFDTVDLVIPPSMSSFVDAMLMLLAALGVVVSTSPDFVLFIVPIAAAYQRIQSRYRQAAKEVAHAPCSLSMFAYPCCSSSCWGGRHSSPTTYYISSAALLDVAVPRCGVVPIVALT